MAAEGDAGGLLKREREGGGRKRGGNAVLTGARLRFSRMSRFSCALHIMLYNVCHWFIHRLALASQAKCGNCLLSACLFHKTCDG